MSSVCLKIRCKFQEYLPVARDEHHEGVVNLPGGADYYTNALRHYTYNDATPEEVHQLGVAESKRITDEMKQVTTLLCVFNFYPTIHSESNIKKNSRLF